MLYPELCTAQRGIFRQILRGKSAKFSDGKGWINPIPPIFYACFLRMCTIEYPLGQRHTIQIEFIILVSVRSDKVCHSRRLHIMSKLIDESLNHQNLVWFSTPNLKSFQFVQLFKQFALYLVSVKCMTIWVLNVNNLMNNIDWSNKFKLYYLTFANSSPPSALWYLDQSICIRRSCVSLFAFVSLSLCTHFRCVCGHVWSPLGSRHESRPLCLNGLVVSWNAVCGSISIQTCEEFCNVLCKTLSARVLDSHFECDPKAKQIRPALRALVNLFHPCLPLLTPNRK